jgi:long-chain acyl-CoA synthetase
VPGAGAVRVSSPAREPDTFPKLLLLHSAERGRKIAFCEKDLGIWQSWGWSDVARNVRTLAAGLAARGFVRGDRLAIVGDNRPRLYWSMAAAQALGGVPVPLYQDAVADEMAYTLTHAEVNLAIAEDQEQVDKLREIRGRCPSLREILYDDPRGLARYGDPSLLSLDFLEEEGRAFTQTHPRYVDEEIEKGRGRDVAIILYTSGTTGHPKGVMLTHDALITTAKSGLEREGLGADEKMLAYLPMAWVGDNLFSYAQALVGGFTIGCPESIDTVLLDLKEIGPTYFFGPPRVYEGLLTQITIRMEDASAIKKRLFKTFMEVARRVGPRILDGSGVPLHERLLYLIGNVLIYAPLKNVLGLSRVRLAYTAGEAVGPDLLMFFRSLGINVKQFYGMTEASVFISIQPDGAVKPDSSGTPLKGVEVKIAEDGEVLFKSPGMFQAYYKDPEATAAARTADGWVKTGDAGFFDEEGHLRIIDRAKDVGRLEDGSLFAPKYLENKLKFFSYVKEAVAFGDGRASAAAFVNIDLPCVANWAEHERLSFGGYMDLAGRDEVYRLVKECIEKVNRDLASEPRLASSQIRRFLVLPKELDADDGELTRTRKVRRRIVAERYASLIEALYSGAQEVPFDTPVRFEDGRTGVVRASVKLRDAAVFPAPEAERRRGAA